MEKSYPKFWKFLWGKNRIESEAFFPLAKRRDPDPNHEPQKTGVTTSIIIIVATEKSSFYVWTSSCAVNRQSSKPTDGIGWNSDVLGISV